MIIICFYVFFIINNVDFYVFVYLNNGYGTRFDRKWRIYHGRWAW
ncbi:MAG: hypothetical protein JWQ28_1785 [Pedobacter sp.]|jgi:hypothetical protein|nr:hypothetical protein [Pedobacter sp.]